MIYELALLVLVAATLCKKASRPFAFVLAGIWLLDALAARSGYHMAIVWVDSLAVYPLMYLAWKTPKWWSIACVALCLLALPIHLWFWSGWSMVDGFGETYAGVYANTQCTVFLVAVGVLFLGNYDIAEFASRVLERVRSLLDASPHFARSRSRDDCAVIQKDPVDAAVCDRNDRLGNRLSGRYRGWSVVDEAKAP